MSDLVLILTGLGSVLILVLLVLLLLRRKKGSGDKEDDEAQAQVPRRQLPPRNLDVEGPRRRQVRHRPQRTQVEDEEDEDDELGDQIDLPEGKIGVKKRRKLEMKAEKRAARERELEDREERKQRQLAQEEKRKMEEEKAEAEQKKIEEEERRLKEEKERQEYEEYLKIKESFQLEHEGFEEETGDDETQNKLQAFIDYIQQKKVVQMEELAGHFQMKTQDVITRVQELLSQELLVGVIDDRGKFIYITKEELESVAKFIKQRGRVSIAELVQSSNTLINLKPEIDT